MLAQRFKTCNLLYNDCNESRSRNGWSFCTPFTSIGNCKSKSIKNEKYKNWNFSNRITDVYLPSYICAYCGNPAALSHLQASLASISVTKII